GGSGNDSARSLVLNKYNNQLAVTGSFENVLRYNGKNTTSYGQRDGFFATMSVNGTPQLFVPFGGAKDDEVVSVDVDPDTNFIVAGNTHSSRIHIGDSLMSLGGMKSYGAFIACLDTLGRTKWVVALADTTALNLGDIYLTSVHVKPDSTIA